MGWVTGVAVRREKKSPKKSICNQDMGSRGLLGQQTSAGRLEQRAQILDDCREDLATGRTDIFVRSD